MKHVVTNDRFLTNERQKWNEIVKEKFAYMVSIRLNKALKILF
jgi:hypothetical protein